MHAGLTLLTMSASFRAASSNFPIVMRYSTYSSEFSGRSCERERERERERESTEGGRLQHLLHSVKAQQNNMMCRVYMLKGHTQTLRCLLYTRMAVSGRLWERANWM